MKEILEISNDPYEEIERCKEDPTYFYRNYFSVNGSSPPNSIRDYQMLELYNRSLLGKFADKYYDKTRSS